MLDVLVHPNYLQHAAGIVNQLVKETTLSPLVAYTGTDDIEQGQTLEQAEFKPVGTFHNHLKVGKEAFDLVAYQSKG